MEAADYRQYMGEATMPDSYLKAPYYKPLGLADGIYRVGPLARVNVAEATGTPRADEELKKFRWRVGRVASSSFHQHYARLIDLLHCDCRHRLTEPTTVQLNSKWQCQRQHIDLRLNINFQQFLFKNPFFKI